MNSSTKNKYPFSYSIFILIGLVLLLILFILSISFGAAKIEVNTAWQAVFSYHENEMDHKIIRTLRLPRTIADLIVGASLAVTGAIMQGTTRNPMADSGLLGISSGAAFAVALCLAFVPEYTYWQMLLYSCLGAAFTTTITYGMAAFGKKGLTPQRLLLSGIAVSMLFGALSTLIAIQFKLGKAMVYWSAGGTASANWTDLKVLTPVFIIGVIGSIFLSPKITILQLGEDIAVGLGLKASWIKVNSVLIVLILTGLSVILVGPISFVGLIVPHIVRFFVGVDYRRIIPASLIYGAVFLIAADLLGRLINQPKETPLGIIFAIIGVPFFLFLSRQQGRDFN
ncbi:FecCD family ABC transporter permease [Carnobacterium sp. FSL E2-0243]|uniref:FecCD family ABC transporter permease n=1 Tax=Carnobacterium sp. FSL E2-0243 TaxID=2921365 RepID=UPI0030F886E4